VFASFGSWNWDGCCMICVRAGHACVGHLVSTLDLMMMTSTEGIDDHDISNQGGGSVTFCLAACHAHAHKAATWFGVQCLPVRLTNSCHHQRRNRLPINKLQPTCSEAWITSPASQQAAHQCRQAHQPELKHHPVKEVLGMGWGCAPLKT
jgi:hypothetical protein